MIETKEYKPQMPEPDRDKFQEGIFKLVGWFSKDFWPKYGKISNYVLIAAIAALAYWYYQNNQAKMLLPADANVEGAAAVAALQGNIDGEKKALESSIPKVQTPAIRGQAELRLGNLNYAQGKYDEADKWFAKAAVDGAELPLVQSGAQHGSAAVLMQKGNYAAAAAKWENFVNQWGKRKAGVLPEGENEDLVPTVPDALWQMALCYKEVGQNDKAKAALNKILAVYGSSQNGRYAGLAQALLKTL